jgi:hypothetical protein
MHSTSHCCLAHGAHNLKCAAGQSTLSLPSEIITQLLVQARCLAAALNTRQAGSALKEAAAAAVRGVQADDGILPSHILDTIFTEAVHIRTRIPGKASSLSRIPLTAAEDYIDNIDNIITLLATLPPRTEKLDCYHRQPILRPQAAEKVQQAASTQPAGLCLQQGLAAAHHRGANPLLSSRCHHHTQQ